MSREKDHILEHVVRFQVIRVPQQERSDPISWTVGVCATAVVKSVHGDWLVEYADIVGTDDDEQNSQEGSVSAEKMRQRLVNKCEPMKLSVLPGKIEVY